MSGTLESDLNSEKKESKYMQVSPFGYRSKSAIKFPFFVKFNKQLIFIAKLIKSSIKTMYTKERIMFVTE